MARKTPIFDSPEEPAKPNAPSSREESLLRLVAGLLAESDLTELEVEMGELRIRAARAAAPAPAPPSFVPTHHAPPPAAPAAAAPRHAPVQAAPADNADAVKSPMVGTAYLRPNPESKAFVEIGARVSAGDKLLLIEAMKTFNDIVAPKAGVVTAILVEDGQPVEYGEPLLIIE